MTSVFDEDESEECGESVEDTGKHRRPNRPRKCKNRLKQLSELFPNLSFSLTGHYGDPDDQSYVMNVSVKGQVFQGIGPSKIKAKIMAAEHALLNLGVINELSKPIPKQKPPSAGDYTADVTKTSQFYDFDYSYFLDDENFIPWSLPEKKPEPVLTTSEATIENASFSFQNEDDGEFEDDDEFRSRLLGKTPLAIVGELQLDAQYSLVDETGDQLHPMFAFCVTIKEEKFYGAGTNKKLAKARAARNALQKLYNLEFSVAEGGMPIYEGDDQIWQETRKKLRKEAYQQLEPGKNPLLFIAKYYQDAKYEVDPSVDESHLFTARLTVCDKTYVGVGTTKTDAKTNAASNAVEELRADKNFPTRQKEVDAQLYHQRSSRQVDMKPLLGSPKNAVAKLNILYHRGVEFHDIAETAIQHTTFMAFTVAVAVHGRFYIGVGKTKKQARLEAAERALRALGAWTNEDESVKWNATAEIDEDPFQAVQRMRSLVAQERANSMSRGYGNEMAHWNQREASCPRGRGQTGSKNDFGEWGRHYHNSGSGRSGAMQYGQRGGWSSSKRGGAGAGPVRYNPMEPGRSTLSKEVTGASHCDRSAGFTNFGFDEFHGPDQRRQKEQGAEYYHGANEYGGSHGYAGNGRGPRQFRDQHLLKGSDSRGRTSDRPDIFSSSSSQQHLMTNYSVDPYGLPTQAAGYEQNWQSNVMQFQKSDNNRSSATEYSQKYDNSVHSSANSAKFYESFYRDNY